jgi:hypothetical protein
VIHVIAAIDRRRSLKMTTFIIDAENNTTAFATPEQATPALASGAQPFTNQQELRELAASWPTERLVEVWNSLPGVKPVKNFKSVQAATQQIWGRIQSLDKPEAANAQPKARVRAQAAPGAPAKTKTPQKATPAKHAHKPPQKATTKKAAASPGTKRAQVVALLEQKGGATLAQIIAKTGWQKHTVRGFMAGTLKKAGYTVESFKPEGGEWTYRIKK